ncbi:hypothetical protein N657DRAFT_651723 [Parathielavia appendiculata]|uniref:Uncharacterized protein n=1 Tax=Parathielavia appendiculata TaxID=2587402 RepID=A0AAN6TP12_9PEZI|nr:hypothetical protein N657DRAFT_651723 [Parathielavia appendiculata]
MVLLRIARLRPPCAVVLRLPALPPLGVCVHARPTPPHDPARSAIPTSKRTDATFPRHKLSDELSGTREAVELEPLQRKSKPSRSYGRHSPISRHSL